MAETAQRELCSLTLQGSRRSCSETSGQDGLTFQEFPNSSGVDSTMPCLVVKSFSVSPSKFPHKPPTRPRKWGSNRTYTRMPFHTGPFRKIWKFDCPLLILLNSVHTPFKTSDRVYFLYNDITVNLHQLIADIIISIFFFCSWTFCLNWQVIFTNTSIPKKCNTKSRRERNKQTDVLQH